MWVFFPHLCLRAEKNNHLKQLKALIIAVNQLKEVNIHMYQYTFPVCVNVIMMRIKTLWT